MSQPIIRCESVSKAYTRSSGGRWARLLNSFRREPRGEHVFWALRDISFTLEPGETLGVVGANGSGKSTLLKLLAGVSAPTRGHFEINGRVAALLELGAGFQPELSGRENVYLNATLLGLSRAQIQERFESIHAFSELGDFIDMPVKHYSSGMVTRLGFAIAVHTDPDLLLVDEVLAVGDIAFQRKCQARIEKLRDNGVSILLVSHNAQQIIQICSKAMLIGDGRVISEGDPKQVIYDYGRFLLNLHGQSLNKEAERGEYRYGTKAAQIVSSSLSRLDGSAVRRFAHNEVARFGVRIHFSEACSNLIVGMTLRTSEGIAVYGTNTQILNMDVGSYTAGEETELVFEQALPLAHGTYFLSFGVVENRPEGLHVLDRRFDMIDFEMDGGVIALGLVDLKSTATVLRDRSHEEN